MSYIRHKIVLTLPSTNPTLLGEQGFAGRCQSAGAAGRRIFRGAFRPGSMQFRHPGTAQHTARHALSLPPHADRPLDSRIAACPTPRNVKRPLEWARCRQTERNQSVLSEHPARLPLEEKDSWHDSQAVTPMRRTSPHFAFGLRAMRARHGRHVFINALRNAHKMAFFPSVPRTVQESSQWLSPQSALP